MRAVFSTERGMIVMALLHVSFYSRTLERETQMDVILPEAAKGLIGMNGAAAPQCPTLYLLHGMSDDQTIWQRRTSIERYAAPYGLAVVMPSVDLGWYTDMYRGDPYFTFITRELPAVCRDLFPIMSHRREDTFAAGLSMGGYGALKCALTYPDRYAGCISLSARCSVQNKLKLIENDPGQIREWQAILGEDLTVQPENDLYALLSRIQKPAASPRFYVACGTEDFLYSESVDMSAALRQTFAQVEYEEWPGVHDWVFWDAAIPRGLNSVLPAEDKAE